jgi:hypothetical protein
MTIRLTAQTARHADDFAHRVVRPQLQVDQRLRMSVLGNVITIAGPDEALDALPSFAGMEASSWA